MRADPFAAIRKHEVAQPSSFTADVKHPLHVEHPQVLRENRRKSANLHLIHPLHDEIGEVEELVRFADVALTVPAISERDYSAVPGPWGEGLKRLNAMPRPRRAEKARWAQLVLDAHKFAWGWAGEAEAAGWSIGSLIGFDPTDPHLTCLVRDIRGGDVISLFRDERGRDVAMLSGAGTTRQHYRSMPDDAKPLWALQTEGER